MRALLLRCGHGWPTAKVLPPHRRCGCGCARCVTSSATRKRPAPATCWQPSSAPNARSPACTGVPGEAGCCSRPTATTASCRRSRWHAAGWSRGVACLVADQDMPESIEEFEAYMRGMLSGDLLHVSPAARELGIEIVMHPPVPLKARPLLELANFITVGLLPARVRRGYGLHWDPARSLALAGGAEYTRRVLMPLLPRRLRYTRRAAAA